MPFSVGDNVYLRWYDRWSGRSGLKRSVVEKITPSGRVRCAGFTGMFTPNGDGMGEHRGKLLAQTPELDAEYILSQAQLRAERAMSEFRNGISARELTLEECQKIATYAEALKAVLEEIKKAHLPRAAFA